MKAKTTQPEDLSLWRPEDGAESREQTVTIEVDPSSVTRWLQEEEDPMDPRERREVMEEFTISSL